MSLKDEDDDDVECIYIGYMWSETTVIINDGGDEATCLYAMYVDD